MEFNLHLSDINDFNPAYSFIIGDFNTRSPLWWELDEENNEGREISLLTSSSGNNESTDQPIHVTKESPSCIDLIFTSNQSFMSASGAELLLYEECHHKLIYGNMNLCYKYKIVFQSRNCIYVKFRITKIQR